MASEIFQEAVVYVVWYIEGIQELGKGIMPEGVEYVVKNHRCRKLMTLSNAECIRPDFICTHVHGRRHRLQRFTLYIAYIVSSQAYNTEGLITDAWLCPYCES